MGFWKRLDAKVELIDWGEAEMHRLFHEIMNAELDPDTGGRSDDEIRDIARLWVFARAFKNKKWLDFLSGCSVSDDVVASAVWRASEVRAALEIDERRSPK